MAEESSEWMGEFELGDGVAEKVSKFDSVEKLAEGYVNLEALQGRSVSMPKDDATDQEKTTRMGEIYTKLGRPDAAAGYKLEKPADLPEGLEWSDEAAAGIKVLAHKLGFNQAQLEGLVAFDTERQVKGQQAMQVAIKQGEADVAAARDKQATETTASLKAEWGESKFDANMKNLSKAIANYGGDEAVELFQEANIDNHLVLLKMFHNIYGDKLAEDNLVGGAGRTPQDKGGIFNYPNSPELRGE